MSVTQTVRQAPTGKVRARGPHLLVAAVVALAVVGAVLSVWSLSAGRTSSPPIAGEPVDTSFGSFTVTRVSTTFVPDTQGPPTQAQHAGVNGSDQLQVYVRLVNTDSERGVVYAPTQFRLVAAKDKQRVQRPAGSTLEKGVLDQGASIDGQVWFDMSDGASGRHWLEYRGPSGGTVRVALGSIDLAPTKRESPAPGAGGHDDGHDDHDH